MRSSQEKSNIVKFRKKHKENEYHHFCVNPKLTRRMASDRTWRYRFEFRAHIGMISREGFKDLNECLNEMAYCQRLFSRNPEIRERLRNEQRES